MRFVLHIGLAIGFFTRLPMPSFFFQRAFSLRETCWSWPLVGALIGGVMAGVISLLLMLHVPAGLVVLAGLGVGIVLTGALHEDGFADFFDGLGVADKARALEVMKDSQVGSFGALALLFSFSWRAVALFELVRLGAGPLGALLMHVGGRGLMTPLLLFPLAKPTGRAFEAGKEGAKPFLGVGVSLAFISTVFLWVLPVWLAVLVLGVGLFIVFLIGLVAVKRFGGMTGDVYGAAEQGAEMSVVGVLVMGLNFV